MQKLTSKQLCIILFVTSVANKAILLPSFLMQYAGRDAIWSVFLLYILEFLLVSALLFVILKRPNQSISTVLKEIFGKYIAKIIIALFLIFFIVRSVLVVSEVRDFFVPTLYESFEYSFYLIPLIIAAVYIITKKSTTIARLGEMFIVFIVIGYVLLLISGATNIQWLNVLPVLNNGLAPVLHGALKHTLWFGDSLILFAFMGEIDLNKKDVKKMAGGIVWAGIFTIVLMLIFTGVFGELGVFEQTAFSSLAHFNPRITNMGRLDWLIILAWTFVQVLKLCYLIFLCITLFKQLIASEKSHVLVAIILSVGIVAVNLLPALNLESIVELSRNIINYIALFFQYLIPLILVLVIALKKNKGEKQNHDRSLKKAVQK